ncbi:MAG TPA: urate hydroxylase PuuD, partial [Acidobacteriota bacterium]|nr:urate hydroxylase PuuD [Acidobacteriota bacterium]
MDWNTTILQPLFKWLHVVAGIMWIGHLYFFNFVNGPLAKTYDADSKKKVVPELMPRALYFFRWGAAWTWITGFLLLSLVYYMGAETSKLLVKDDTVSNTMVMGIALGLIVVVFFIYDALWKMVKNETVGTVISYILVLAYCYGG